MRSFDFAPFYRSTVGFDRLFSMLDQVGGVEGSAPSYPPYNIARTGENDYRISVAVAGFTDADLSIEVKENMLTLVAKSRPPTRRRAATCSTRHRRAGLRTQLPTRRPYAGQGCEARERASPHRPHARDPRGDEAAGDPDCELQQGPGGPTDQAGCLKV